MMTTNIRISDIVNLLGQDVKKVYGNTENVFIKHLKDSESVDEYTLDWINPAKTHSQERAEKSKAKTIIVDEGVPYSSKLKAQGKVVIKVASPKLAVTKIGNAFFIEKMKPGVDPSAKIHPKAKIGTNFYAGPNANIGKCEIGDNVTIHTNVVIYDGVKIGCNVLIKAGAVLGGEGFGFERTQDGKWIKFPQLGGLIIQDWVEIGANTCIDRGALSDTVIGFGTKINNLCHIAHNVVIGQHVVINSQVAISGSCTIEDDAWIAPNASLRGHQRIGKAAIIGTGAVVTKDVPSGETWVGNPAKRTC